MAKVKEPSPLVPSGRKKPRNVRARELEIGALAYDLAEQRIRNGTATSQEVTYFLKACSPREQLELDILEEQKKLVTSKRKNIEYNLENDESRSEVIEALKSYRSSYAGMEIVTDDSLLQ